MKNEPKVVAVKQNGKTPDPVSEYYRECKYCKEPFTANHQLRCFCNAKHGIPNYCKNRFKVLLQGARLAGENVVVSHKEGVPAPAIVTPQTKAFDGPVATENISEWESTLVPAVIPSPTQENSEIDLRNKKILGELMIKGVPLSFNIRQLIDIGLDFQVYDTRKLLKRCDLAYIEIGIYALFWTTKNEILITPITEILWM